MQASGTPLGRTSRFLLYPVSALAKDRLAATTTGLRARKTPSIGVHDQRAFVVAQGA